MRILSLIGSLISGLLISLAAAAQLPLSLDGSMAIYTFPEETVSIADSLKPVKVVYVARHGARYLSGEKKMEKIRKALKEAKASKNLSSQGEAFLSYLDTVAVVNAGRWGLLSPEGIAEENRLAETMNKLVAPLDGKGARVKGVATFVPRAVMTMYEFSHRLIIENEDISVATDQGHEYSKLLYCFAYDEQYADYRKNGNWNEVYDAYVEQNVSPTPAANLFANPGVYSDHHLRKLSLEMYEVLKADRAAGIAPMAGRFFTEEEYRGCYEASNLSHYLRNNVTALSSIAGHATAPLLHQIISDADAVADNGDVLSAIRTKVSKSERAPLLSGYFGHAETLLPLFSLMKLPGCYYDGNDYDNLSQYWQIEDITPLAANFTLVLCEAPSGECYALTLLNGKVVNPLPQQTESAAGAFIPWREVRAYWLTNLNSLKAN